MTNNFNLNAGLPSIYDRALALGDILVLGLPDSNVENGIGPKMMAEFFRITRRNFLFAKIPLGNLSIGSTVGYDTLTLSGIEHTSGNQQIFSMANTQQFIVYHAAICTDQNNPLIRIGIQNPAGYQVNGFTTPQPPKENPPNSDVFGWYRDDLAQNNGVATELTEQIYIYNSVPNFALALEAVAASAMVSGNLLVHGAGYQLSQIIDNGVQDKILAGAYAALTKYKTFGALLPFSTQVPPQWTPPRELDSSVLDQFFELVVSAIR
jgi:hypothetical protein